MYALIDPNWGDPVVVPSTIRATREETVKAATHFTDDAVDPATGTYLSLYSGASMYSYPHGTQGNLESLERSGFTIKEVTVEIVA